MHALPLPAEAEDWGVDDNGRLKNMSRVQTCQGSEQGQAAQTERQELSLHKCLYDIISKQTLPIEIGS